MEKILTVVVPTYNMEKYLDRCLTSLIVEDSLMDALEVIVVNDGSKDSSSQIAHSYEEKYPQTFIVIDKENGNYGSCINAALKVASGIFIRVLDADDCYDNNNFEGFLNLLLREEIRNHVDCILSDAIFISETGNPDCFFTFEKHFSPESVFTLDDFNQFVIDNIDMWEVTYRRTKCLIDIQYYQTEGISYTDQEWVFKPIAMAEKFYYWPHVIYRYTVDRKGQTVDMKVYLNRYDMELAVTSKLLSQYAEMANTNDNQVRYLTIRIVSRIRKIYFDFFVYYRRDLAKFRNKLKEFDCSIYKLTPGLYSITDGFTYYAGTNHKFVHDWRIYRSFANPAIILMIICICVKHLKNSIMIPAIDNVRFFLKEHKQ